MTCPGLWAGRNDQSRKYPNIQALTNPAVARAPEKAASKGRTLGFNSLNLNPAVVTPYAQLLIRLACSRSSVSSFKRRSALNVPLFPTS